MPDNKKTAKDWEPYFRKANVRVEDLDASKSSRSKTIKIGQFLSPNVGREVPIQVGDRSGKAVLRVEEGHAKEKRYFFEIMWDADVGIPGKSKVKAATTVGAKKASSKQKKVKKAK